MKTQVSGWLPAIPSIPAMPAMPSMPSIPTIPGLKKHTDSSEGAADALAAENVEVAAAAGGDDDEDRSRYIRYGPCTNDSEKKRRKSYTFAHTYTHVTCTYNHMRRYENVKISSILSNHTNQRENCSRSTMFNAKSGSRGLQTHLTECISLLILSFSRHFYNEILRLTHVLRTIFSIH